MILFICSCLSFMGGVFVSSFILFEFFFLFLISGIFLISFFLQKGLEDKDVKKYSMLIFLGVCLFLFSLGSFRYYFAQKEIKESVLNKVNGIEEIFTVEGIVSREPDRREDNLKITLDPLKINNENLSFKPSRGKILVTLDVYPEYEYGDKIEVTGKIVSPENFEDFNYKDYLVKEGIYSLMYFPESKLIEKESFKNIFSKSYALVLSFKDNLRESIYSNFSPPGSFILGAVILGDKSRIPQDWKEKLSLTGLRHVTAVSGMHVAIILGIIISFLNYFKISPRKVFFLSSLFVSLFILLTGLQVSALRAGAMAFFFLLAELSGRRGDSLRVLILIAAILILINPFLLKSDIGFHLSFSAVLGIFCFFPSLRVWTGRVFLNVPNFMNFKDILALTFSAQVFTLPILIYNFGYLSLISPLSNILIVPFLPALMIFGFISGILGMIFPLIGFIFSFPAYFILKYFQIIILFFSSFSFAFIEIEISGMILLSYFLILLYIGLKIRKNRSEWFLKS